MAEDKTYPRQTIPTKTGTGKAKELPPLCEICVNKCAAIARVEEGIITKLNPNPLFPKSKNMICARGNAGIQATYDPDRLKTPLIRIGKRGEGTFKQATWEEAYEAILNGTEHFKGLKQILDEEKDNRSTIGYCAGEGMAEHTFKTFLADKIGSSNFVNHASICLQTTVSGHALTFGSYGSVDFENTEYVIMAGANRAEAIVTPDTMDIFKRTKGRGAKLICVDPRFTNTAAKSDKWVPIKVGTDLAFVLALTYVVMTEELYDKAFLEANAKGFDEYKEHIISSKYTPEWAEKITGIKAKEITTIAREFMAHAPKAIYYQGRRSTFSTQDFQLRRAQAMFSAMGGGIDVKGGIIFGKKLPLGKHEINAPMYANAGERIDKGVAAITGSTGTWIGWRNRIIEKKTAYPVRAMFTYKQNPMLAVPNTAKTHQLFEGMDLVVTIDTMPSDTVIMSDVVLPEATYLEREDPVRSFGGLEPSIALRQKVIKPMFESKPVIEILAGLAHTLTHPLWEITQKYDEDVQEEIEGKKPEEIEAYYKENGFDLTDPFHLTQEEINRHMVVSKWGEAAWKTLREKGVFYPNMDKYFKQLGENKFQYYPEKKKHYSVKKGKFPTPSGKIEFTLPNMATKGLDPMPIWRDEMYVKTPEGKFKFITGRHAQFTQNGTQNNAVLLDLIHENYLWINTRIARERGIAFGDTVEVTSRVGSVKIKAYLTEEIAPDNLFFVHGFGAQSEGLSGAYHNGAADNTIIEDIIEPYFGAAAMHATIVDVRKV
jgi:thiosulfate reductase/polysulfide reductase chain A